MVNREALFSKAPEMLGHLVACVDVPGASVGLQVVVLDDRTVHTQRTEDQTAEPGLAHDSEASCIST